jgi:hypothetical protein
VDDREVELIGHMIRGAQRPGQKAQCQNSEGSNVHLSILASSFRTREVAEPALQRTDNQRAGAKDLL